MKLIHLPLTFIAFLVGCNETKNETKTLSKDKQIESSVVAKKSSTSSQKMVQINQELLKSKYPNGVPIPNMIEIPEGQFQMGNSERAKESPVRRVSVNKFKLAETEVTWEQYQACVDTGPCPEKSDEDWGRGKRPAIYISWETAQTYIKWLNKVTGGNYRLPTESEWEYAARASSEQNFYWGNEVGENKANCSGCGSQWDGIQTAPVKSFEPNSFGIFDMHGNVWEWVEDCFHRSYESAPLTSEAWLGDNCKSRMLRGGSWNNGWDRMSSSSRHSNSVRMSTYNTGFRLAQDI